MATIAIQTINDAGRTPTYAAATTGAGDVADNAGNMFLHVKNGSGSEVTVTVTAQTTTVESQQYGTLTKANVTKAIAGGADAFIGPFKTKAFNNASNQIVVTYSAVTSVTVAAFVLA